MTRFDWKRLARAVKVLGTVLALTAFGALVADDVHQRNTTSDLLTTQRRSRPVTDFNTAFFVHLDCVKAYEVEFFADIADGSTTDDPGMRALARQRLGTDRDQLRATFNQLCQPPSPPKFDNDGKLTQPPVTHPQTFPVTGG